MANEKPTEDSGIGEAIGLVILAVVVVLIGYGGYAAWRDFRAPDDKCYWMVEQATPHSDPCLIDVPTPSDTGKYCMRLVDAQSHYVICDERKTLADFANKAGRRICGQKAYICDAVKK